MPAVLCPAGQVWDGLPGSNCVSCGTCTEYGQSPWCSRCILGTKGPATLVVSDDSALWTIAVLTVAVLLIAGVTFYCYRRIGQKYDKRPVTTMAVTETIVRTRCGSDGTHV